MKTKIVLVSMLALFLFGCTQAQIDTAKSTTEDANELLKNSELKKDGFENLESQLKSELGE